MSRHAWAGSMFGFAVRVAGDDWACDTWLGPERLPDDHREVFVLLAELDPVFTLRFDEGGEILVNVSVGDGECLALTAYEPVEPAA